MSNLRKPEKVRSSGSNTKPGFAEANQRFEGGIAPDAFGSETVQSSAPEIHGFGARIARTRKARGLTQDALSDRVLVSLSAIKAWEVERSAPRIEQAVRLAEVLNVSLDWMFTGRGDADLPPEAPPVGMLNPADRETLVWGLGFVESTLPQGLAADARASAAFNAATEFRRAQGLNPLPELVPERFARSLQMAEQLLGAAATDAPPARRIALALDLYAMVEKLENPQETATKTG